MDIEKTHISLKTFVVALIAVVTVTVSGTATVMTMMAASEKLEYINDRLDKITKRNAEAIQANSEEIADLKKPNSDKKK